METINLQMSFETAAKICIMVLQSDSDLQAKIIASDELLRYAKELDRLKQFEYE